MPKRTNPFASPKNALQNFTKPLCAADAVFGEITDDFDFDFSQFLEGSAVSSGTFRITDSKGEKQSVRYTTAQLFQVPTFPRFGTGPWTIRGEFEALPNGGCTCNPSFEVEVQLGQSTTFDQRLQGRPVLTLRLETAPSGDLSQDLTEDLTTIGRTSETIAEGSTAERDVWVKNTGNTTLYIQFVSGANSLGATVNFLQTTPFTLAVGEEIQLGQIVINTTVAGSKSATIDFYGNQALQPIVGAVIEYTVTP